MQKYINVTIYIGILKVELQLMKLQSHQIRTVDNLSTRITLHVKKKKNTNQISHNILPFHFAKGTLEAMKGFDSNL